MPRPTRRHLLLGLALIVALGLNVRKLRAEPPPAIWQIQPKVAWTPQPQHWIHGEIALETEKESTANPLTASLQFVWPGGGVSQYGKHVVDAQGPFRASTTATGNLGLIVSVPGHGSAFIPEITLGEEPLVIDEPIRLAGKGVLSVRVLHPNGQPVPHLAITAKHVGTTRENLQRSAIGRGTLAGAAATNEDGLALMRGLFPGEYRVTASSRPSGEPWGKSEHVVLFADALLADGDEHTFEYPHSCAVVRVVGFNEQELAWSPQRTYGWPAWPQSISFYALRLDGDAFSSRAAATIVKRTGATLQFCVRPGARYRVFSFGGTRYPASIDIDVPLAVGTMEAELVLNRSSELGEFTLGYAGEPPVQADSGPLGAHQMEWHHVGLADVGSKNFSVTTVHRRARLDTLSFGLPPGTYALRVAGRDRSSIVPRRLARFDTTIAIRAGRETHVKLRWNECSGLNLVTWSDAEPVLSGDELTPLIPTLSATLFGRDGFTDYPAFEEHRDLRMHGDSGPYFREALRSTCVAAGEYLLRVTLNDGREMEQEVVLLAGETTNVELKFPPAPAANSSTRQPVPQR